MPRPRRELAPFPVASALHPVITHRVCAPIFSCHGFIQSVSQSVSRSVSQSVSLPCVFHRYALLEKASAKRFRRKKKATIPPVANSPWHLTPRPVGGSSPKYVGSHEPPIPVMIPQLAGTPAAPTGCVFPDELGSPQSTGETHTARVRRKPRPRGNTQGVC